jgi:hypothetical protein
MVERPLPHHWSVKVDPATATRQKDATALGSPMNVTDFLPVQPSARVLAASAERLPTGDVRLLPTSPA